MPSVPGDAVFGWMSAEHVQRGGPALTGLPLESWRTQLAVVAEGPEPPKHIAALHAGLASFESYLSSGSRFRADKLTDVLDEADSSCNLSMRLS